MRTGLVDTKGKKYMRYGYYEVRCRQNGATGTPDTGWPAVSMYNEWQWPPEYEVAEYAIAWWVPDWSKMNQSIILDFNNDGGIDYNNTPRAWPRARTFIPSAFCCARTSVQWSM